MLGPGSGPLGLGRGSGQACLGQAKAKRQTNEQSLSPMVAPESAPDSTVKFRGVNSDLAAALAQISSITLQCSVRKCQG